jgi:hypothetical protein
MIFCVILGEVLDFKIKIAKDFFDYFLSVLKMLA